VLNARQFALKLIANVTYGYTAAGFSGRMPCAELADSIVQCGRLTLERAIHLVNSTAHWNAQVVYGDTDSMFVHLEGRTKEDAFKIGQEIAAAVTAMNPTPVTLKMEKVYHPCVLLTKKRYVGYSFESPGQLKPIFDAKGIETVRRDSCAAVAKTLERSLRILFETQDLSQVKQYLQRQWGKILSGRISLHDFIFAKEVRLGTYSARASVLPPAAIVASKAMAVDPRAEPRYGERVPYVVVHGEPGARLSDVVVDPHTMLANGLRLHDTYYITKQIIPALQRVFGLVGADLKLWFAELPRVYRPPTSKQVGLTSKNNPFKFLPNSNRRNKEAVQQKGTIDHYYLSQHCTVCGQLMRGSQLVCTACISNPQAVVTVLTTQTAQLEKEFKHLEALCRHCGGANGEPEGHIACISLDCPIFFERLKVQKELQSSSVVSSQTASYPPSFLDLF
jgi:DNA polymerase zeta